MKIKSVCPKCGKIGTQAITYHPNKANSKYNYLEMIHSKTERCYIGRIHTTDEAMSEFNKPETVEEYKVTLTNMVKEIQQLIKVYSTYSPKTKIKVPILSARLKEILKKYGY